MSHASAPVGVTDTASMTARAARAQRRRASPRRVADRSGNLVGAFRRAPPSRRTGFRTSSGRDRRHRRRTARPSRSATAACESGSRRRRSDGGLPSPARRDDPKRMCGIELVVAIGRDTRVLGVVFDRVEPMSRKHVERRLVGPVHVLENEDGWSTKSSSSHEDLGDPMGDRASMDQVERAHHRCHARCRGADRAVVV